MTIFLRLFDDDDSGNDNHKQIENLQTISTRFSFLKEVKGEKLHAS